MKFTDRFLALSLLGLSTLVCACSPQGAQPGAAATSYPEQDGVYIISPRDGEVVTSPVTVRFGLKGKGVAPAGVAQANTGHHHLLIDVTTLPPLNVPIPADANHVHFGGGQTQATVELTPGRHTLQLILGDHMHIPHNPPLISERITITVK